MQPEVKKFVKAFRYLGDVIVACGLNKKIKNNEINIRPPPPRLAAPTFLQPETNTFLKAFRYLADAIVA